MSNLSGASTGSTNSRWKGRVVGVPKKRCWCGEQIIQLISRSETNPYRRYYRCGYVVATKWVDEGHLNEIEMLKDKISKIEEKLEEATTESKGCEIIESSSSMKKMVITAVVGCVFIVGVSRLVG
ncbi:unnamed protein product [Microthlaspi erraticum]|uniref:Zinc finger GRF-type domain-containing protein n=1 Tax=Microthlaspi erraticum TaxID=1685480 RepID=A0A6D2HHH7_9BRAS|nr:unnamed protein product [Microthlaspi erraticum]